MNHRASGTAPKPYAKPEVVMLGNLAALTKRVGANGKNDGGGIDLYVCPYRIENCTLVGSICEATSEKRTSFMPDFKVSTRLSLTSARF